MGNLQIFFLMFCRENGEVAENANEVDDDKEESIEGTPFLYPRKYMLITVYSVRNKS